jgi:hypothetical protein
MLYRNVMTTPVLAGDPNFENLKLICFLLNGEGELPPGVRLPRGVRAIRGIQFELRRLVGAWENAGFDGNRLLKSDDSIARRLQHMKGRLVTTATGMFRLEWPSLEPPRRQAQPRGNERWQDFAYSHFAHLVLNPYVEMLGGPCSRCKRYFVKKAARRRKYCCRSCQQAGLAVAATRKRLARERAAKLDRAQIAADKWMKIRHTNLDWKSWTEKVEPDLTKRFLTRAVNRGELRPPKKGEPR